MIKEINMTHDAAVHAWNRYGLVKLALAETDFLGDLHPATLSDNAANSADLAAEICEDRLGVSVPLALIVEVRAALVERGYRILLEREQEASDWQRDAQEAGDLDANGDYIGYDTYRSV